MTRVTAELLQHLVFDPIANLPRNLFAGGPIVPTVSCAFEVLQLTALDVDCGRTNEAEPFALVVTAAQVVEARRQANLDSLFVETDRVETRHPPD